MMKLKHQDITIDPNQPFGNCKLGREKYATILTSLVNCCADGFVLAINNKWGTGKTTFVKMWQQQLKKSGFKTLYFNAWENDFENGALTALMSELSTLQERGTKNLFKKVIEKGAVLSKSALPILLKAVALKFLDKDTIKDLLSGFTDDANDLLQTQIHEYASKKIGLIEFKTSLTEFVQKSSKGKPIVFIIDELDRCRPDYAVDVLEKVKHFFGVPGMVYVLSIDKIQLGNAVRGVYGSDRMNADEYLRRFIDIEYVIPEPNTELFCKYLFDYFDFSKFFNSHERRQNGAFRNDSEGFMDLSIQLFNNSKLTLRQQEKIFAHARVALNSFYSKGNVFPELFLVLIYFKDQHQEYYQNIKEQKISIQILMDSFESLMPSSLSGDNLHMYIVIEAQLVFFYNNYINHRNNNSMYSTDENGARKFLYHSKLGKEVDSFENIIIGYTGRFSTLDLSFLLEKIDLLENMDII